MLQPSIWIDDFRNGQSKVLQLTESEEFIYLSLLKGDIWIANQKIISEILKFFKNSIMASTKPRIIFHSNDLELWLIKIYKPITITAIVNDDQFRNTFLCQKRIQCLLNRFIFMSVQYKRCNYFHLTYQGLKYSQGENKLPKEF
ncbi:Uncharacterised protein [Serratia marcescens]|nr:Uncharacterised protein [Serratia marcescens]CAI2050810.1 Uncharacterised protein [Serratia marcescens]